MDLKEKIRNEVISARILAKTVDEAVEEIFSLFNVSKCTCEIPGNQTHFKDGKVKWTCFKCKKPS
tara:strand:- start:254 stop:448 length:195 start_codon:yes stop_codon:yes gene_type:complete